MTYQNKEILSKKNFQLDNVNVNKIQAYIVSLSAPFLRFRNTAFFMN